MFTLDTPGMLGSTTAGNIILNIDISSRTDSLAATTAVTHTTPLFCDSYRLSAELRNEIYRLALFPEPKAQRALQLLHATNTTLDDKLSYEVSLSNTKKYTTPSLLHTSRRLRIEASGTFYSNVVFFKHSWHDDGFADDMTHCRKLLDSLRLEDRQLVKKVRVETHIVGLRWVEGVLGTFSELCDKIGNELVRELLEVPIEDGARGWGFKKVKGHPYGRYEYDSED